MSIAEKTVLKRKFQHNMIVRQEHLNHHGNIFGGVILSTIDELAFVACTRVFPHHSFVTKAVLNAEFMAPAKLGDVLEFNFGVEKVGRTSVQVRVEMLVHALNSDEPKKSFDGKVVMVCINCDGMPIPIRDEAVAE